MKDITNKTQTTNNIQNAFSFMEDPTNISIGKNFIHFYDYFFDKEINDLMKAISFVGSQEGRSIEDKILIYFESFGGSITCLNRLIDYMSICDFNFEFVASGDCASAGCYLPMFLAKNEKFLEGTSTLEVMPDATFLLHLASCSEYDLRSNRDTRNDRKYNEINKKILKEIDDKMIEICKEAGMSEEDIKLLELGQDIVFTSQEFTDMLTNISKANFDNYMKSVVYGELTEAINSGKFTFELLESFINESRQKTESIDMKQIVKMLKDEKVHKISENKKKEKLLKQKIKKADKKKKD